MCFLFCFFKQKTAYEMRISDWSSDVCSSDLAVRTVAVEGDAADREVFLGVDRAAPPVIRSVRSGVAHPVAQGQPADLHVVHGSGAVGDGEDRVLIIADRKSVV